MVLSEHPTAGRRWRLERSPDHRPDIMPYWSIYCLYCQGYIADALLECVPAANRLNTAYRLLFRSRPGAALACPYCNRLVGFDDHG